jgi:succinyl-diaminopimelate desuccinylase
MTDLRSGMEVTNVTPGELKMMFNVRNSTLTNTQTIEEYLKSILEGVSYSLRLDESAKPFCASKDAPIVKALEDSILKHVSIKPKHSTAGGTSDDFWLNLVFKPLNLESKMIQYMHPMNTHRLMMFQN